MLENSYVYPDNNAHVSVANDNRNRGCYRIQDGQTHYFQATCELHRDYRVYRGWHFGKSLGKIRATPAVFVTTHDNLVMFKSWGASYDQDFPAIPPFETIKAHHDALMAAKNEERSRARAAGADLAEVKKLWAHVLMRHTSVTADAPAWARNFVFDVAVKSEKDFFTGISYERGDLLFVGRNLGRLALVVKPNQPLPAWLVIHE